MTKEYKITEEVYDRLRPRVTRMYLQDLLGSDKDRAKWFYVMGCFNSDHIMEYTLYVEDNNDILALMIKKGVNEGDYGRLI